MVSWSDFTSDNGEAYKTYKEILKYVKLSTIPSGSSERGSI